MCVWVVCVCVCDGDGDDDEYDSYVVDYDTSTNFKFATVQGAGHMVPTYKPVSGSL